MKRDMDLVRKILFELQEKDRIHASFDNVQIEGYPHGHVFYHLTILTDSPYVTAVNSSRGTISHYRLTWQGHEFIDSIADPDRWAQIKQASSKVGGFTFEMISKIATELMIKAASGQLNL